MKVYRPFLVILLSLLSFANAYGQLLPPNRAEQDACNALKLCGNSFTTPYSYQGLGSINNLPVTPCGGGEANSVWLQIEISQGGTIVFTIAPKDTTDDYDFAVVDATDVTCDKITIANVVRCNFNNNLQPNTYYIKGITGLDNTSALQFVANGTYGSNFLQAINAKVGDVYLIMINNFGNGTSGSNLGAGFTIDFTGSTATFVNNNIPAYDSIGKFSCGNVPSMNVHLNTPVLCSSIAADGSDFQIVPAAARINSAVGVNCNGGNGYTEDLTLTFSNAIPGGNYTLRPMTGTDNNTLISICGSEQLLTDNILFNVVSPTVHAGNDTITCVDNPVQLFATIDSVDETIKWSPSTYLDNDAIPNPITDPKKDITYYVTVTPNTRPDCARTDTINVTVLQGFDLANQDTLMCRGASDTLRTVGDNRYAYSWTPTIGLTDTNTASTIATPNFTTTYTVTATYPGCRDSSHSVTINLDTFRHLSFTKDKDSICAGIAIYFTPVIDTLFTHMTWNFGDGFTIFSGEETVQHAYTNTGAFIIRLTANFPACPDTTFADTVYILPAPLVNIGPDTAICFPGNTVTLARHSGDLPGEALLWNTGATSSSIDINQEGEYWLQVVNGNCTTADSILIKRDCYVEIPNAFTPNGDGINDYFFPRTLLSEGVAKFHMSIFNRWGQLIFETNSADGRGWDGATNGTKQLEGVYVYVIEVSFINGQQKKYNGNITLLR